MVGIQENATHNIVNTLNNDLVETIMEMVAKQS